MTTPARRTRPNTSAKAAAQQSQTQAITVTLSATMVEYLKYQVMQSGGTPADAIEAHLFVDSALLYEPGKRWPVGEADIVSPGAKRLIAKWRAASDDPRETARRAGMMPSLCEMESAVQEAMALIKLFSEKLVKEQEDLDGQNYGGAHACGLQNLSWSTGSRLYHAFYGRPA